MSKVFVKAVIGRTVYVPNSADVVTDEGIEVEDGSYWRRRIHDGDVLLAKKPKHNNSGTPDKDKK